MLILCCLFLFYSSSFLFYSSYFFIQFIIFSTPWGYLIAYQTTYLKLHSSNFQWFLSLKIFIVRNLIHLTSSTLPLFYFLVGIGWPGVIYSFHYCIINFIICLYILKNPFNLCIYAFKVLYITLYSLLVLPWGFLDILVIIFKRISWNIIRANTEVLQYG